MHRPLRVAIAINRASGLSQVVLRHCVLNVLGAQEYRQQFTDLSNLVLGECSRTQLVLAILRHSDIDKDEPVDGLRGASATEVAKETKPDKGKKKR